MRNILLATIFVPLTVMEAIAQKPDLKLPFTAGESWQLTRGYNPDNSDDSTHQDYGVPYKNDRYALDFAMAGCDSWRQSILAAASGTVIFAGDDGHWGRTVLIDHGNGYVTRYSHFDEILVKESDQIFQGQSIGLCGNSGTTFGSSCPEHPGTHLHFAFYLNGEAEIPEPMSGNTDFTEGEWYTSDNYLFTPSFNYPDFSSVEGLDFYGSAIPDFEAPAIQLTDEVRLQAGSFYYREPQYIKDGFEATATVWISRDWADGFAFVILNQYDVVLGAPGGGIGYQGIPGCAAIEFDNWQNKAGDPEFEQSEDPGIHAGFHTLGAVEGNSAGPHAVYPDLASGETRDIPSLFDAEIHNLKIRYLPGVLSIYIDDMVTPVLEVPVDLDDVLKLPDGLTWVGFTGATGAATQIQDILSWSFAVNDKSLHPDLTAEIQVVPPELYAGELAEVNFTVLNNSDFPAETSQATVNFGSQSEVVAVPALAVGETFSSNVEFNLIAEGQHVGEVIADSTNVVTESDEGNNTASVEVTVLPPRPDLTIGQVNFSSEVKGQNARISADVWIHNVGNADTEAFSATVKVVETGDIYLVRFDPLAAGQSEVISISDFLKKVGDKVTLEITIDDDDEIAEIKEFNNEVEYSYAL